MVGGLGAVSAEWKRLSANDRPSSEQKAGTMIGLPTAWQRMRKLDMHNHVFDPVHRSDGSWKRVESMIEAAEILGIEKLCCSKPITGGVLAGIEEVREANDAVIAAMRRYPARIQGYCFLQPGNGTASLDELKRCLDEGMMGVKLYNQYKISDPIVYPIVERCIQAAIPLLSHSAHLTDPKSIALQPKTSDSLDFCQLATRYPEFRANASSKQKESIRTGVAKENASSERYLKLIPFAYWSPWNGCKAELGGVYGGGRRSQSGSNQGS
jgi:predicted TIM-barrel fold metal-dependent hydrolase